MKKLIIGFASVTALLADAAMAQTTTPPAPSTTPPAMTAPTPAPIAPSVAPSASTMPEAGAPLSGANSFTEAQAKSKFEQLGYSKITNLVKDTNGVWRGRADKDGKTENIALDYRGNIVVGQN
jgi:opacity protein-like surface antigen